MLAETALVTAAAVAEARRSVMEALGDGGAARRGGGVPFRSASASAAALAVWSENRFKIASMVAVPASAR